METRVVTRPTSSMGTSAWSVEVSDRICLNGSVPKSARPGQVVSFLIRHLAFISLSREPAADPAAIPADGRWVRRGKGIPAICFATPTVVDVQGPSRPCVAQRAPRRISDEKFDELFAALGTATATGSSGP
jgi:hypothetical protein